MNNFKALLLNNQRFIVITLTALLILFFTPNNKIYILAFILYPLALCFLNRNTFSESIFLTLLFSLPFERGIRDWFVEVVSPGYEYWMPGYSFYFGITPKLILSVTLIILYIFETKKSHSINNTVWILIGFFILSFISTIDATYINIAIWGFIRLSQFVWLYIIATEFFTSDKIKAYFPTLLFIFSAYFSLIGVWQFLLKHPIGLYLEDVGVSRMFGYLTTEGESLYRVSGFTGHPTFFGSLLSLFLPLNFAFLIQSIAKEKSKYIKFLILITSLLIVVSIISTVSRSAWLVLFLVSIYYIVTNKNLVNFVNIRMKLILIALFSIGLIFFGSLVFTRSQTAVDLIFGNGFQGRYNLINHAAQMIKNYPIWGVGLNHFTKIMESQNLTPAERSFFYPVHNTFLLFFSELGILAGSVFIIFVAFNLIKSYYKIRNSWLNMSIWLGAVTFLINAQFHTLFNLDPSLDIFMIMLAYLISI